jgi:thiamine biosynthesis lipoprotein ApbE
MVLGKAAGIRMVNATLGLDGVIIDRDGSLRVSPGFSARLRDPS